MDRLTRDPVVKRDDLIANEVLELHLIRAGLQLDFMHSKYLAHGSFLLHIKAFQPCEFSVQLLA
jgi:hypothetical protein